MPFDVFVGTKRIGCNKEQHNVNAARRTATGLTAEQACLRDKNSSKCVISPTLQ